tara:strand:+ start:178006 stop:178398 length:393 start_codon:yes stop_codon:yes gene_type:complete
MFVGGPLVAEQQQGIVNEFRAVEEAIRTRQADPKVLEAQLQDNLLRAMRVSITRRFFHTRDKYLNDLKIENLSYEKFESTNTYYVKYKSFIVRYDFVRDPERFVLAPAYEKFLIMDENFDADHQDQPANP